MPVPIKVLIVDDSALVRRILTDAISVDGGIEVVGTAPDAYYARDKIVKSKPDVLLLDIEMPRMDGLAFLERLMLYHPMPVIIISSLVRGDDSLAQKAMSLGAAEVFAKPGSALTVGELGDELIKKIKSVARWKKKPLSEQVINPYPVVSKNKIIAIGASTGGTVAIQSILSKFPPDMPPIVIVQHMPQHFTKTFAEHLDRESELTVREASDGEYAKPGTVLVARGNKHMVVKKNGDSYYVELKDGELIHHQRPSIEVLFRSVVRAAGSGAIGVILTGMGRDGTTGLLEMKKAGAYTIAQDEKTSIVYGMPKEAFHIGAVVKQAPLDEIPAAIMEALV